MWDGVVHQLPHERPRGLGAGVLWRGRPHTHGGCLGWDGSGMARGRARLGPLTGALTGVWLLRVAWASSPYGVWVLRRNEERKCSSRDRGRSGEVFFNDLFGGHAVSLRGNLGDKQVTETSPDSKGGGIRPRFLVGMGQGTLQRRVLDRRSLRGHLWKDSLLCLIILVSQMRK